MNDSLNSIAKKISEEKSIVIFPHLNMDGDAIGSGAALCAALRMLGKTAYIAVEDELAENLKFLDRGFCANIDEHCLPAAPDISIAIDCSEESRFEGRKELFYAGKSKICIDHHATAKPIADLNYIDPNAAATAEIVYDLIRELEKISGNALIDKSVGEAILSGIMTDTGNFQYSNTTARSHTIAAELLESGVSGSDAAVKLFQSERPEKIKLNAAVLDRMKIFAGGRAAIAAITRELLEKTGADLSDSDGIVETMRSIRGIETSVLLKENEDGRIKVSMRAKSYMNVSEIVSEFGGGGHVRAAGCTLADMKPDEAEKLIAERVCASFEKLDSEKGSLN